MNKIKRVKNVIIISTFATVIIILAYCFYMNNKNNVDIKINNIIYTLSKILNDSSNLNLDNIMIGNNICVPKSYMINDDKHILIKCIKKWALSKKYDCVIFGNYFESLSGRKYIYGETEDSTNIQFLLEYLTEIKGYKRIFSFIEIENENIFKHCSLVKNYSVGKIQIKKEHKIDFSIFRLPKRVEIIDISTNNFNLKYNTFTKESIILKYPEGRSNELKEEKIGIIEKIFGF